MMKRFRAIESSFHLGRRWRKGEIYEFSMKNGDVPTKWFVEVPDAPLTEPEPMAEPSTLAELQEQIAPPKIEEPKEVPKKPASKKRRR